MSGLRASEHGWVPPDKTYLTSAEVGRVFCVDPRTVTRWRREGKLRSIRTPGGHYRYDADEIKRLLGAGQ